MTEIDTDTLANAKVTDDLSGHHPMGSEEFLYDLIGINITGIKSLGTLITRPKLYFDAALSVDWQGRYWPSMRLWFGLMTILIGLQFLWASESSEMTAMFRALVTSIIDGASQAAARDNVVLDFSAYSIEEAGKKTFKTWIFIYPFFFVAFMCFLAFIFRGWERKLPFVARTRFIFAIIVPGSIIGLLATFLMLPLKGGAYQTASFVTLGATFLAYWITAYRGAYAHCDKGTAIGMSLVVSILIIVTLFLAQLTSMILSLFSAGADIAEIVREQRPHKGGS